MQVSGPLHRHHRRPLRREPAAHSDITAWATAWPTASPRCSTRCAQNIKYGADLIKICATGGVLSKGDDPQASQYTLEEMQAIVADAHRLGRKVAAHAHGAQGILWATEAGVDSIEHGSYINDEAIAAMKKHGTYLVPTLYLEDWMLENGHLPPYST